MSFRKRLYNIARAEVRSAAGKVRSAAEGILGASEEDDAVDAELEAPRVEATASASTRASSSSKHGSASRTSAGRASVRSTGLGEEPEHIRRFYANLELPIGAGSLEVKAAYRRLMRRYHPDLHQEDVEKARVATQLAQELRTAYEGLLAYLGPRGR